MTTDMRTRICRECGLAAYWHATAYERKSDPNACNILRSAVAGSVPEEQDVTALAADSELAQDLYPIFVALVDWSRKTGRTEVNAIRAALRAIGTSHALRLALVRRYAAGTRATADLHREGRLT